MTRSIPARRAVPGWRMTATWVALMLARLAATWVQRVETRRALARLDAAGLADVGISEAEARRECRKPFWRA